MAKALKNLLLAATFLLLIFVALELSLRVYLFGWTGLSPAKVGSFSLIFSSGFVQPATDPDIWYELKPNQKGLFRGAPFRTNSQGLADDEYTLQKPPNTVRVAVIGSSWTMGAGVPLEDTFHSILERQLNAESAETKFEFISFGVEFYGLQEIIATAREKVLAYNPDLILLEVTGSTPSIRWAPHTTEFVPLPYRNRAWDSVLFLRFRNLLGQADAQVDEAALYRDAVPTDEWGTYFAQIERAFYELAQFGRANNIPVAAAWLRANVPADDDLAEFFLRRAGVNGIGGAVINLDDYLQPGEVLLDALVSRVEPHPNAYGHQIIAAELRKQLLDQYPMFRLAAEQN